MHTLYGLNDTETNKKIDTVIQYISNDDFHSNISDGYGILTADPKKKIYHGMGWDPKYPGWFDVSNYIENNNDRTVHDTLKTRDTPDYVHRLLFFAEHIVNYPVSLKTKWFTGLRCCLEKCKTDQGTYIFPKEWLPEKTGYAVVGYHMSYGENKRKKNWLEIESTFYMQLINKHI
jgi:hypothetical protein